MKLVNNIILSVLILIACVVIYKWRIEPIALPELASSGRDGVENRKIATQNTNIGEFFEKFDVDFKETDENWIQFRGATRDNIVKDNLDLDFNKYQPEVLWRIPLGQGYASTAISKGRVFVLDYDEKTHSDMLRCFDLSNGKEIWRRWYNVKIKRNHGISRTVPAVSADGEVVISLGPLGHIMAVNTITGDLLWTLDLCDKYLSVIPQWYAGQCPLIYGDEVVIAPAGKDTLLVGLDLHTGKEIWKTQNPAKFEMSHSSVMLFDIAGKKQFVYAGLGGLAGVSATGEDKGKLLWHNAEFKPNVFAPSPVYIADGKFLLTAGYGAGGAILQVELSDNAWSSKLLKRWKPKEAISSEQQTPIFYNDKIYSIMPKDAGKNHSRFICSDIDANTLYISAPEQKFGLGPYILIGDTFLILDDEGVLYSVAEKDNAFLSLGKTKILNGHDAWGPLAYVNSKLLARDMDELVCIALKKK